MGRFVIAFCRALTASDDELHKTLKSITKMANKACLYKGFHANHRPLICEIPLSSAR